MAGSVVRARLAGLGMGLLLAAALPAACSSGSTALPTGGIEISGAWVRAAPMTASAGAAYAIIRNGGPSSDALVGAESPAAGTVEVHETYSLASPAASGGMGSPAASGGMGMGGGNAMGMRPIRRLEIPAGGSVELKPGSYHIMMMGLKQDLKAGDSVELTLIFETVGRITVSAQVRTN